MDNKELNNKEVGNKDNTDTANRREKKEFDRNKNNKGAGNGRGNGFKDNKQKRPKQMFAHKGMVYQSKEDGIVHDWNCPVIKNANIADYEEFKEAPILTGCICNKCGRGILFKKYTDDKEEGRALSKFYGENGISTEFLCEMYEVYHIFPYVYNSALKLSYKDEDWKIVKGDNKLVIYHNDFGENMPGWFNDYWNEYQTIEGMNIEAAIKVILTKEN